MEKVKRILDELKYAVREVDPTINGWLITHDLHRSGGAGCAIVITGIRDRKHAQ